MRRRSTAPVKGLLREILHDPERDHCPGARPVVSFAPGDDAAYAEALRDRARCEVELRRRGRSHGRLVELAPEGLVRSMPRKRRVVQWTMRWNAAKPIVRHGLLASVAQDPAVRALVRLRKRLAKPNELGRWLAERAPELDPRFEVAGPCELVDPERDVAKVAVHAPPDVDDLWLKAGRLSTHGTDDSLRLRFSFGIERADDASTDERRHALVRELFERAVPGGWISDPDLLAETRALAGAEVGFTQPIVYWNAPEGGARFHHDSFDGPAEAQQAGVLYVQLEGRTAWIAASITDLALRVREFLHGSVEAGARGSGALEELAPLAADWPPLMRELAEPDQGRLGALVNRPEFTAFLADSGHAAILGPGDAIWLPNHGLDRTAMHAVFCASPRVATGLSFAIRRAPAGR